MMRSIILDSAPLALIVHQRPIPAALECRAWLKGRIARGHRILVPAIVVYELRRELLRLNRIKSLELLDEFVRAEPDRYLTLGDDDLRLAAKLWADLRKGGTPTADPHALDVDVILAAQAMSLGHTDFVVATTNVAHVNLLVNAEDWRTV
jgi:predicted nucleic acid-binding protein